MCIRDRFTPGDRYAARSRLGLPHRAHVVLFVGRIQPLKAPDLLVKAARQVLDKNPGWTPDDLVVGILGGPSGSGLEHPESLAKLAAELGMTAYLRFVPPADRATLAQWYRAVSYTHLRAHETVLDLVCRLLLEKKNKNTSHRTSHSSPLDHKAKQ